MRALAFEKPLIGFAPSVVVKAHSPETKRGNSRSSASAPAASGTSWALSPFMRSAGMVQSFLSKSTSGETRLTAPWPSLLDVPEIRAS